MDYLPAEFVVDVFVVFQLAFVVDVSLPFVHGQQLQIVEKHVIKWRYFNNTIIRVISELTYLYEDDSEFHDVGLAH